MEENKETFSERHPFINGVLQGLVKIYENKSLFTPKLQYSYTKVLADNA